MKILSILTADSKTVEANKAKRSARALKRKQEALIDQLEGERDDILSQKEALENVTVSSVNESTWATEYQACKVNLALKEKEIEMANETLKEFFAEEKK